MRIISTICGLALLATPLALADTAVAASAHNSQAGGFGQSQNPTDSTPASPRVKHGTKHRAMRKSM